jgi:hypothetical protein
MHHSERAITKDRREGCDGFQQSNLHHMLMRKFHAPPHHVADDALSYTFRRSSGVAFLKLCKATKAMFLIESRYVCGV